MISHQKPKVPEENNDITIVSNIKVFRCTLCKKSFNDSKTFALHMRYIHVSSDVLKSSLNDTEKYSFDASQHICEQCGEVFSTINSYQLHHKNVHEGPKITAVASVSEVTYSNSNVQNIVSGNGKQQDHKCSFCDEVFGNYPNESFIFNGCFLP